MEKITKHFLIIVLMIYTILPSVAMAEVYGGGYWEAIGLGNMPLRRVFIQNKGCCVQRVGCGLAFWVYVRSEFYL